MKYSFRINYNETTDTYSVEKARLNRSLIDYQPVIDGIKTFAEAEAAMREHAERMKDEHETHTYTFDTETRELTKDRCRY